MSTLCRDLFTLLKLSIYIRGEIIDIELIRIEGYFYMSHEGESMQIIPVGTSRLHEPMSLLHTHEACFLQCGYVHSSGQVLDLLKILVGEIDITSEQSRWFFRKDQTPANPFDVRLWSSEKLSEAVDAMRKRWNECSACIIEICTPRTYILDGINVQGNPNIERNVSYAEIWKDGYYKTYEPKSNVATFDESELQISNNIADICRILDTHNKSGLFLGHLVDPRNPHPARSRNNATLKAAFDASSFGLVKYFDCSSFVEEYGFRILENGSQDIHHLPWDSLESLAKSFEFTLETLIEKGN
jgi:hypothetical protein